MEIIKPYFVLEDAVDGEQILRDLERYARTCYKSEDKTTSDSARKLVAMILKSGHESVLEHEKVTVRIICDRGVTHEIVRHRIASYSQESTRYCNYKSKGIKVIEPLFYLGEKNKEKFDEWFAAMLDAERHYLRLIELGSTPQEARSVLPNSLKTEIVVTYNLREWRHFFKLRCAKQAHPQMLEITTPLLREFHTRIPVLFDDIAAELLPKEETCSVCGGQRWIHANCFSCGGTGRQPIPNTTGETACRQCGGSGKTDSKMPCPRCGDLSKSS